MHKQLFFSHAWSNDYLNRNTHDRVINLVELIQNFGWTTWLDEDDMYGNIDAAIVNGIDNADAIIICLTGKYCDKINRASNDPRIRDNCLKEWTYANARNKLMIPIIMEPELLDKKNYQNGIISLYFGSTLYIDASKDSLICPAKNLSNLLKRYQLTPINNEFNNENIIRKIKQNENILRFKNIIFKVITNNKKVVPYNDELRKRKSYSDFLNNVIHDYKKKSNKYLFAHYLLSINKSRSNKK